MTTQVVRSTEQFAQVLGVKFRDLRLIEEALTHASYINENPDLGLPCNERLEFLGDALLGLVIAAELYRLYPGSPEGELTQLRSSLVRAESLVRIAESLELGEYLRLGQGEETSGGRHRNSNLAGALEAVLGAVFLDRGWLASRRLVLRLWRQDLEAAEVRQDYKSRLQEVLQARQKLTPHYRTVREITVGPLPLFEVEVLAGSHVVGRGTGTSKKRAQQAAARDALSHLDLDSA